MRVTGFPFFPEPFTRAVRPFILAVLLLLVLTASLVPSPARAGEMEAASRGFLYVKPDGTGTVPTIGDALDQADHGDTIVLADGIFQGSGNRDLDCFGQSLVIFSESGDPSTCVIDLGGSEAEPHAGFYCATEEPRFFSLSDVTIQNSYAIGCSLSACGGALISDGYDVTLSDCVFEGNHALGGGGVYSKWPGEMTLRDCRFTGNSADWAGAFAVRSGFLLTVEDCVFSGNVTTNIYGRAVEVSDIEGLFTGCRIDSNEGGTPSSPSTTRERLCRSRWGRRPITVPS